MTQLSKIEQSYVDTVSQLYEDYREYDNMLRQSYEEERMEMEEAYRLFGEDAHDDSITYDDLRYMGLPYSITLSDIAFKDRLDYEYDIFQDHVSEIFDRISGSNDNKYSDEFYQKLDDVSCGNWSMYIKQRHKTQEENMAQSVMNIDYSLTSPSMDKVEEYEETIDHDYDRGNIDYEYYDNMIDEAIDSGKEVEDLIFNDDSTDHDRSIDLS